MALVLSPEAVEHDRTQSFHAPVACLDDASAALSGRYSVGRLGESEEVAAAAAYLASDEAAFLTGSDPLLDGGYTAF